MHLYEINAIDMDPLEAYKAAFATITKRAERFIETHWDEFYNNGTFDKVKFAKVYHGAYKHYAEDMRLVSRAYLADDAVSRPDIADTLVEARLRTHKGVERMVNKIAKIASSDSDDGPQRAKIKAKNYLSYITADLGRETVIATTRARGVAFCRVPEPGACTWCLMIASKGTVYKSEFTAKYRKSDGNRYHNNCRCVIAEVLDEEALPQEVQSLQQWVEDIQSEDPRRFVNIDEDHFKDYWKCQELPRIIYNSISKGLDLTKDDEAVLESFLRHNRDLPFKALEKADIAPRKWFETLIKYSPHYRDRKDHIPTGRNENTSLEILDESKNLKLTWRDIYVNTWGRPSIQQPGNWLGAHLFQHPDKIRGRKTTTPKTWSSNDLFYATFATLHNPDACSYDTGDKSRLLYKIIDGVRFEFKYVRRKNGALEYKHCMPKDGPGVLFCNEETGRVEEMK